MCYEHGFSEIIDIIFTNCIYDLSLINNWGSYYTNFLSLFTPGSTDFASTYEKSDSKAINSLEDVVKNSPKDMKSYKAQS